MSLKCFDDFRKINISSLFLKFPHQINKYPWMVAILDSDGQFCGGTLVASQYVISAAHCMFSDEKGENPYTASQLKVDRG